MSEALLFSGGVDSSALAFWLRPAWAIFVDYGQVPAAGEFGAAKAIANTLSMPLVCLRVPTHELGSGLLANASSPAAAPTPEWWPFRNQLLATLAAAWAIGHDVDRIILGSVASDRKRHVDGSPKFYQALNRVLSMQEGRIQVKAPALELTSAALVATSRIPDRLLGWTHSCHVAAVACGTCPGCIKRREVLAQMGRLL